MALASMLMLSACSGADEPAGEDIDPSRNSNANSTSVCKYADRLEFPKMKGGNSRILTYLSNDGTDPQGVNYCVEWDTAIKSQRWSCYVLNAKSAEKNTSRYYDKSNQYPQDPQLSANERFDDYIYGSGFDHGHICPSADRLCSATANYQTFYMTNMQPQTAAFNGSDDNKKGQWSNLEAQIRSWATQSTCENLYICKGGTIDNEDGIYKRISGKLIVPRYFFCALLLKNADGYKSIGFWFDQIKDNDDSLPLRNFAVSVDELEKKTGIDFFCNLPDYIEVDREKRCDLRAWGLQ